MSKIKNFDGITTALQQFSSYMDNLDAPNMSIPEIPYISISKLPKLKINLPEVSLTRLAYSTPDYSMNLPNNIDIFSELPIKLFDDTYNAQIGSFMRMLRREYIKATQERGKKEHVPKFEYHLDNEDKSQIIQMHSSWDEGDALIYFSFEEDERESNMGIVWNDNELKNYETRAANMFLNKKKELIHEAIDFIYRVY